MRRWADGCNLRLAEARVLIRRIASTRMRVPPHQSGPLRTGAQPIYVPDSIMQHPYATVVAPRDAEKIGPRAGPRSSATVETSVSAAAGTVAAAKRVVVVVVAAAMVAAAAVAAAV